jgi:hypothetical protein
MHQHQCLFIMQQPVHGFPFQPHWSIIHLPEFLRGRRPAHSWYAGIFLLQGFQFLFRTNGFIKETAGITHHFRIGQLALANRKSLYGQTESSQRRYFSSA